MRILTVTVILLGLIQVINGCTVVIKEVVLLGGVEVNYMDSGRYHQHLTLGYYTKRTYYDRIFFQKPIRVVSDWKTPLGDPRGMRISRVFVLF